MARSERRNLYRILQVQPEAVPEVIKASYRALIGTLRAHPDLGGDHETAARLNAAYAVLSDPERRAAYDRSLRRGPRSAPPAAARAAAPVPETAAALRGWREARRCPFCGTRWTALPRPAPRCTACDSPLTPAPSDAMGEAELLGRRRGDRVTRALQAQLRLPGFTTPEPAEVRDLSLSGVSLRVAQPLQVGSAFRLTASGFDAVAEVVAQRRTSGEARWSVHARLLTLQVIRTPRGTFVSETA